MMVSNKTVHVKAKLHIYMLFKRFRLALVLAQRAAIFYLKWRKKPYAAFYAKRQNKNALRDHQKAVGGLWEEIGRLQFDYVASKGLKPEDKLLDLGCGSLRGGRWFIHYLQVGNYWGIDISHNILEAGKRVLVNEGLADKNANLIVNHGLTFKELEGRKFDYILAHSVFTHMPEEDIEKCFRNLHKILKRKGAFFTTFKEGHRHRMFHKIAMGFRYPASFFHSLGEKYGYSVRVDDTFVHPRRQKMLEIRLKRQAS